MLNTELFLKVADHIEKHPESYDQCTPLIVQNNEERHYISEVTFGDGCGTFGCVAGWSVLLSSHLPSDDRDEHVWDVAKKVLGLNSSEAIWLFDMSWTPPNEMPVPEYLRLVAKEGKLIGYEHKKSSI